MAGRAVCGYDVPMRRRRTCCGSRARDGGARPADCGNTHVTAAEERRDGIACSSRRKIIGYRWQASPPAEPFLPRCARNVPQAVVPS